MTQLSPFVNTGVEVLFYVLLLIYTIYAVFLAYHWFTYGSSKRMSLVALATYLIGGAVLFLTFSYALTIL